jgi:small subunit ribosomal protein S8
MVTDTIADYLTRIRNAQQAGHKVVEIPASNLKKDITKILYNQGYILSYKFDEGQKWDVIKIALKYNLKTREPGIRDMQRISRPGLRHYVDTKNIPRVLNGLGIAILSTSKGVVTDKDARNLNVGGEVLCYVH